MTRPAPPRGFALLLTLLLVLLLGAALVGLAFASLTDALQAQDAVEELQRRWAVTSCQATLLPRAENVLRQAEKAPDSARPAAVARRRITCELAGVTYDLIFTDEQAKLNVNTLLQSGGRPDPNAAATVSRLARASGSTPVRIRPLAGPVDAYGQVFEDAGPEELSSGLADALTCWGSGAVRLSRASDAVLAQAAGRVLRPSEVADLLAARRRDPECEVSVLLSQLASLDQRQKERLRDILTDRSSCHGLWVVARGSQRSWYFLAVCTSSTAASSVPATQRALPAPGTRDGALISRTVGPAGRSERPSASYRFIW